MALNLIVLLAAAVVFLVLTALVAIALLRRDRRRRHRGRGVAAVAVILAAIVVVAGLGAAALLFTARTVFVEATDSSEDHSSYTYHSTRELTIESGPGYVGVTRIDGGAGTALTDGASTARGDRPETPPGNLRPAAPRAFTDRMLPFGEIPRRPLSQTLPQPVRYILSGAALILLISLAYLFIDVRNRSRYTWLRRASWALAFLAVCLVVWRTGLVFGRL